MDNLKLKILQKLLDHLEEGDAMDIQDQMKPKPKVVGIDVKEMGVKSKDPMEEGSDEPGPMEKLLEQKEEQSESPEEERKELGQGDGDDLSDDELEELIRERMK